MRKSVKCPKCGSDEITAYGFVIGRAPIIVKTMEVDDNPDYCEPWDDINDLDDFTCHDCEFHFDDDGDEIV